MWFINKCIVRYVETAAHCELITKWDVSGVYLHTDDIL